jgi:3-oxoacyl-[acyl-carrier protein] reductase
MRDLFRLDGRVALVTGASRGLGLAMAEALAAQGASVVLAGRDPATLEAAAAGLRARGLAAEASAFDVADAAASVAAVRAVGEAHGGRLDILVNNAGIAEHGPIGALPDAAFDRMVDVNVRGVWHTTSAALAHLGDEGRIINIGSFFSERVPFPSASAYGMTKHAIAGMTKGWARDLAPRRITVNTVEPGPIETEANPDAGERSARLKAAVPLGRYGQPEEVAELVAFLASPAAAFVTAAHVLIDGGMLA